MTWFRRGTTDAELAEEIREHLEETVEHFVEQGMSRPDAEAAARRRFGNVTAITERSRDVWRPTWLEDGWADFRFGLRQLRRTPSFAAAAILTLALGIGATAAIFSLANAALLHPIPFPDPDRLVTVNEVVPLITDRPIRVTAPDLIDYQRQSHSFAAVAGWELRPVELSGSRESERVQAARVSASLFDALQSSPTRGRAFTEAEDREGAAVCVISDGLWRQWFGADPDVLDRTVRLDRQPYRVVGVMARGFAFPLPSGGNDASPVEVWIPMSLTPAERAARADNWNYNAIARMKPAVTIAQASADVNAIAGHIVTDELPADARSMGFRFTALVRPLAPQVSGVVRPLVLALAGAVACLLLIACVNVANLLLARGAHRRREMTVRAALGAGRGRLLRQLICETMVFALVAAALGGLLAWWSTRALAQLIPQRFAVLGLARFDWRVLTFSALLAIAVALVAGIVPGLAAGRATRLESLAERGSAGSAGHRRIRNALVIAEIALALVLLVGAGLLVRTFSDLMGTNAGFHASGAVAGYVSLPEMMYPDAVRERAAYAQILERLHATPGTIFAGMATTLPLNGSRSQRVFWPDQYEPANDQLNIAAMTVASPEYLQAIGATLLDGRVFTPEDDAAGEPVALVSEAVARQYWPGRPAVGKRLKWGRADSKTSWLTVVGVVEDVKQESLDEPGELQIYVPAEQVEQSASGEMRTAFVEGQLRSAYIVVRGNAAPEVLEAHLRDAIRSVDRSLAVSRLAPLADSVTLSAAPQRFNMLLMSAFAAIALILAIVGLYGLIAYAVAQRTREIGVRMAMGARAGTVVRMIVGEGMVLACGGVAVGCAGAAALAPTLRSLLFGVKPLDAPTFAAVALLLLVVAAVATYVPARRATRIDPTLALRAE